MRSCATRSTNLNGPEHTGLAPNLSPAASAALGDTIIPARSVSTASRGANGAARLMRTVDASTASTLDTTASSPRRFEPFMSLWRSRLYFTACASNFSPSWKVTPLRSLTISDLLSFDHSYEVASCGTTLSFSSRSNSLSHRPANTMRPTNVRAIDGSRTSGSSARPTRRVWAWVAKETATRADAKTIFIMNLPFGTLLEAAEVSH